LSETKRDRTGLLNFNYHEGFTEAALTQLVQRAIAIMIHSKILINLFKIFAIGIVVLSFSLDLQNTLHYGGVDLRPRVVGARLLAEGKDPYFFSWQPGMSEKLLDPLIVPGSTGSRIVSPPNILALHALISSYPFLEQKIIWLVAQWASLLAIIALFWVHNCTLVKRSLIIFLGLCFLNSCFWRLHVERGQIYIVYTLLLAIAWHLLKTQRTKGHILSGFILGFTASLRPPIVLMMIPFAIYRQWTVLVGSIFGIVLGLSIPLGFAKTSIWNSYYQGMQQITRSIEVYGDSSEAVQTQISTTSTYPKVIEGLSTLQETTDIPTVDSSLAYIFEKLGLTNIDSVLIGCLVISISLIVFILLKKQRNKVNIKIIFLIGFIFYIIGEFFIPAPRYSYNDVQWILPILMTISQIEARKIHSNYSILVLSIGLILSIDLINFTAKILFLSIFAIAYYVIASTISLFIESPTTS
jgi:hypothetical protein